MKAFEYVAPRQEAEVLEYLSDENGATELLAGGTDLVGLMKKMVITPQRVVNLMEVDSIRQIETQVDGGMTIGAAVTLDELLIYPELTAFPAVLQAIRGINSMQLQCQGTIGGELCQRPRCWFFRDGLGMLADGGQRVESGDNRHHAIFGNAGPAKFVSSSRLAPGLIALGARLRLLGPKPDQETFVPLSEFYRVPRSEGQRETILEPRQFVTHILLPPPTSTFNATYEVRHGEGPEFPLAAAAAALDLRDGLVHDGRIVLGQVAPTPWSSTPAIDALRGRPVTEATAEEAGEAAIRQASPLSKNEYKVPLAKVAVKRAVLLAAGLETGGF